MSARKQEKYARYQAKRKIANRRRKQADERISEYSLTICDPAYNTSSESINQSNHPPDANPKPITAATTSTDQSEPECHSSARSILPSNCNANKPLPPIPHHNDIESCCIQTSSCPKQENEKSTPIGPPTSITWSSQQERVLEMYPHMLGDNPNRRPTPSELQYAKEITKSFHYFHRGKVVVRNNKKMSEIIAVIEFTRLEDLTAKDREDINKVTQFLHEAKPFVNTVDSSSRSWGGNMWAIGWRKCMEAFELIGRYRNQAAISKALEAYHRIMGSSSAASDVLGKMFRKLSDVAFEENRILMETNKIPGFACLEYNQHLNKNDCAPNLTFTENGYFNKPHLDTEDLSEFALVLFIPISKESGELITDAEEYDLQDGKFVFPDYGFGIDLTKQKGIIKMVWRAREYRHCTLPTTDTAQHTLLGMSLQVNKKTSNTSRDIQNGSIMNRKSNRDKDPNDMFIGGHAHLTKSSSSS
jgi:hypothetical protein